MNDIDQPLDLIGTSEGTDKCWLGNDYLRHYERIFGAMRDDDFNLLEIGVADGGSTRTWARYFSRARIIGADIHAGCRAYATDRVTIEIGSQTDPYFLHRLAATYDPRVIIDDGSHKSYDVIFTFERLFPTLQPGGIYIIEDLHFHAEPEVAEAHRAGSPILAHDYVFDLIHQRIRNDGALRWTEGLRGHLIRAIDRVEIFGGAAVFYKKTVAADRLPRLRELRSQVEASNSWLMWLFWAHQIFDAGGDPNAVVEGFRKSVTINPSVVPTYEHLAQALERVGDTAEALAVLDLALTVPGIMADRAAAVTKHIERLRAKVG